MSDPISGRPTSTSYRQATGVLARRSLDTVLLLAPGANDPVALSGSAVTLWDLFSEEHTLEQVLQRLQLLFQEDDDRLRVDFGPVFAHLVSIGALAAQEHAR